MEREEFKILVKAMKAVYAQPTFIPDHTKLKSKYRFNVMVHQNEKEEENNG